MAQRTQFEKAKRGATKMETWSTEETQFPVAYEEVVKQYAAINKDRVLAFRFKVWLKPVRRGGAS